MRKPCHLEHSVQVKIPGCPTKSFRFFYRIRIEPLPFLMRPFHRFSSWLRSRRKSAPRERNLQSLLDGYRATALLYVAVKLKIADQLTEARSGEELSRALGANPLALQRLLRGLVALGVCSENSPGVFQMTSMGQRLRSDSDGPEYSLAILNGEEYAAAWNDLLHSIKTGDTAFDHVFGESPWQHRQKNPELNQRFNEWLEQGAAATGRALLKVYDFAPHKTVADIGGGQGALLTTILQAHPSLQGILFDQPHVVSGARQPMESAGIASRCQIVPGDFFKAVPPEADAYILKSILHDWDDKACGVILQNCRTVLKPGRPLLVVEKIMPASVIDRPSTVMGDLHMLAVTGGRERTADEYRKLFAAAGLELKAVFPLRTGHSLLQVLPV